MDTKITPSIGLHQYWYLYWYQANITIFNAAKDGIQVISTNSTVSI